MFSRARQTTVDLIRHGEPEAFEGAALIVSSLEEVNPELLRGLL